MSQPGSVPPPAPAARLTSENLHDPVLPWVDRHVVALRADQSVDEARASVRQQSNGRTMRYLYVVDERQVLLGHVPVRDLLVAHPATPVRDILHEDVIAIPSWATVLVACEFFVNRRLQAFPIVEESGRLVGAVDASLFTEEMLRLARQSFDQIFQLAGVSPTPERSIWKGFVHRFPWLLCNIVGGLLAAFLAGLYQDLLDAAIVLALFIPVVLALSESISIQAVTLALQALHVGEMDRNTFGASARREAATALLLGGACGLTLGVASVLWKGQMPVSLAIAAAIGLSMTASALVGLTLPTLLHVAKANPRIASGPTVLATADTITLLVYFTIAGTLLG